MMRRIALAALGLLLAVSAQAQGVSPSTAGGTPGGAAGGDLSGTYPNPTVASIGGHLFSIGGTGGLTFTLAGPTTVTLPTSGTLASTANNLGIFAATTSAQLAGVISDETGTGALVFGTSSVLSAATLSGITTLPGSGQIDASGNLGIGMIPANPLDIAISQNSVTVGQITNNSTGTAASAQFTVSNGTNSTSGKLTQFGTGFTSAGMSRADGTRLAALGAGGLTLTTLAAQPIYFGINNVPVMQLNAALTASKPVYTDASLNLTSTAPAGYSAVLSGTTGTIGGSLLAAGACAVGTATVTGARSTMAAVASPSADPDSSLSTGVAIYPFVSANDTVTVRECAIVAVTPTAVPFNVRVMQ